MDMFIGGEIERGSVRGCQGSKWWSRPRQAWLYSMIAMEQPREVQLGHSATRVAKYMDSLENEQVSSSNPCRRLV